MVRQIKRTAIVGGGAAGFFMAIRLKELAPTMEVDILERTNKTLAKVALSGGGRCNCTNSFEDVKDLQSVYPRGHRLMKRLFKVFGPQDAYQWFESHGIALTVQPDHCVFPVSQSAQTIIDCFGDEIHRLGVRLRMNVKIESVDELLKEYDYVAVATGGFSNKSHVEWLGLTEEEIVPTVPSLFTLSLTDIYLRDMPGAVAENVQVSIAGTNFKAQGPLLITHWGVSGPAILKLSSYAARHLAEHDYKGQLLINWANEKDEAVMQTLQKMASEHKQKMVRTLHPYSLPSRIWEFIVSKVLTDKAEARWADIGKKDLNRLINALTNDTYDITGRAPFRDEFVMSGGVSLSSIDTNTLASKRRPRLFFAGEVLDIDGITGGFNLQAAWTTAVVAARGIAEAAAKEKEN